MSNRYWNGYRWVDDPPMARAEPRTPTGEERAALMDAELCPRTITEESEPLSVDSFAKCDSCSSEYDSRNGDCPVCLMLGRGVVPEQPTPNLTSIPTPVETLDKMLENFKNEHRDLEETIKTKDKEPIKDVVISDEVRERLRKELGIGDGSK